MNIKRSFQGAPRCPSQHLILIGLHNPSKDSGSYGMGFITRKDGKQTHEILQMAHDTLCTIPHREGISAEGVGDGAGINVNLSLRFLRKVTHQPLEATRFGVGNFSVPKDAALRANAERLVEETFVSCNFSLIIKRNVPLDNNVLRSAAVQFQLPIVQWVFAAPSNIRNQLEFEKCIYPTLLDIEECAFTQSEFDGLIHYHFRHVHKC